MTQPRNATAGIVFALHEEERGLKRVLSQSRAGCRRSGGLLAWNLGQLTLLVAVSGVGRRRSAQATRELLEAGAQCVVCAGFAAALDGSAEIGDVVVANRVLTTDGTDQPVECSRRLLLTAPPSGKFGFVVRHGDLVTCDSIVITAAEKARIYRSTGAVALDMESHAAGQVCARAEVPFAAVRSISDSARDDLPRVVETLAADGGVFRTALAIASSPGAWLPLLKLRRQMHLAAANLGEALGLMLLRIV